jgi:diguanylate cyclase (GGDEF)-like protein/PAS domain S-box-containing protein
VIARTRVGRTATATWRGALVALLAGAPLVAVGCLAVLRPEPRFGLAAALATDVGVAAVLLLLWHRAAAARSRSDRADAIVGHAGEALVEMDGNGTVLAWNHRAEEVFGWRAADVVGRRVADFLVHPSHMPGHLARMHHVRVGRTTSLDRSQTGSVLDAAGGEVPVGMTTWVTGVGDEARVFVLLEDRTEQRRLEEELRAFAEDDALTGLTNRRISWDRLATLCADTTRSAGAVLLVDLDSFKDVNDTYGHAEGDRMLVATAQLIAEAVATFAGATAGRLGGDEFILVLPDVAELEARWLAASLVARLQQPFQVGGHELEISASIGLTLVTPGSQDATEVLRDADLALYEAKHRGRHGWAEFEPRLYEAAVAAATLEAELRATLRGGGLTVYYQPTIRLSDGAVQGVEALVRWEHPQRGLVSPEEFIHLAEQRNLIGAVGTYVLREACEQLIRWRESLGAAAPQEVSVNVSVRQLTTGLFADLVEDVLRSTGLPGRSLVLEITESVLMHESPEIERTLWDLRTLGVRLSVDDFGTGYSSLSRLRFLPAQTLKIDRSFVSRTPGRTDEPIVRAIVAMAHSLAMDVVVEGVETPAQLDYVRSLGCEQAQGFLISPPLPAADLPAWLEGRAGLFAPAPADHRGVTARRWEA